MCETCFTVEHVLMIPTTNVPSKQEEVAVSMCLSGQGASGQCSKTGEQWRAGQKSKKGNTWSNLQTAAKARIFVKHTLTFSRVFEQVDDFLPKF